MAKTGETLKLEKQIFNRTVKQGVFGCFEVTIGWFGKERVDFMTYDTKGIFKCYEIKVSKADFHSKAKISFVGHYNYYVMTKELYEQVKDEIPPHIGVYVDGTCNKAECKKRADKQEVAPEMVQTLKDSIIRSLTRYFNDQIKSNDENSIKKLERELATTRNDKDKYYKDLWHIKDLLFRKFGSRYMRIIEEMEDKFI